LNILDFRLKAESAIEQTIAGSIGNLKPHNLKSVN